ncbi:phosphocholine cytidylyltransferase family protein [Candidatus Woesearchaeota archaeon]|nr:phosphocholine cytidylyltransferase family protein [Candidatus Woesearchaeota archaeon]
MESRKPKVILLVAGEGKRLRPYTLDRPKCMVEIDGISLIDRQLAVLKAEGLDDIVMVGGYKSEMLKRDNVRLKLNSRYYETNMVWTLFSAEEELDNLDRDVIVSYGDIVYSREILQALLKSTTDIAVIIDKEWESYWRARNENPLDDAETLKIRRDGTISEIGQKPKSLSEIEGQYMGLMKFSVKGIKQIKEIFHTAVESGELLGKSVESSYMTDLLQVAINSGRSVTAVPVCNSWIEVDTVKDLKGATTKERLSKI